MTRRHGTGSGRAARSGSASGFAASAPSSDPLAGVERVFIDGSNLLHALARERGRGRPSAAPAPPGAVIGRIRAAFPASVTLELVFDGPAAGGVKGRLATGLRVGYSGRATADQIIDEGVGAQLAADGPAGTWGILVVTDDRGLGDLVRAKGARVAGTAWLAGRIGHMTTEPPRRGEAPRHGEPPRRGAEASRGGPSLPRPKAGTTIGHRRPLRAPNAADRD